MKVFVAVFICLVATAMARPMAMATASASSVGMPSSSQAPMPTATPTAMPPPPDSTGEMQVTVSDASVTFSATNPSDDDDFTYMLQLVGTQEVYNSSGKWTVLEGTEVTNYTWTSQPTVYGFDQVGSNNGATITVGTIVSESNETGVPQVVSISGYVFSNDSADNYLTLLYQWTATNSKGKEKNQKVLGNSNETVIVYGDAFFGIASIAANANNGMTAGDDGEILTYDKKEKQMWFMLPYSATDLQAVAAVGVNASNFDFGSLKTLASNGMPAWAIALIVVGSVLFLVAIIAAGVGGYMMYQKRRQGYEAI